MLILLAILACQDPFPEDRHDLSSFRIAAVSASEFAENELALRALVYSGSGLWHETAPTVTWSSGGAVATGPSSTLSVTYPATILLEAKSAEGEVEHAEFSLDAAPVPPTIDGWERGSSDLTVLDAGAPVDERLAATVVEDVGVAPEGGARLAILPAEPDVVTTHWMGTAGTFMELSAHATDWFAATAEIDDGEVETHTALDAGIVSTAALTYDGKGGNTWTYIDVAVGDSGPSLLVDGRIFPVAESLSGSGWFEATLALAETPAGIVLSDVAPASGPEASAALCGLPAGVVFDFSALAEGWCDRASVEGARIVVSGTALP